MKFSIFIYICRKNTRTDFCIGNYSKATSNYNNKYNVGNWELVWHSLIRQNNVDICQSQTSFTLPHRTPIQKGCVRKFVVPSPLLLFKHKNFMPFQRPHFKIESISGNNLKPLSRACVNSARIVLQFVTKYCFSTLWKCAYPCKTTMILHTCLPQHSTQGKKKVGNEIWVVMSKLQTFTTNWCLMWHSKIGEDDDFPRP